MYKKKIREVVSFIEPSKSIAVTQTQSVPLANGFFFFFSIFLASGLVKDFLSHLLKRPEG